jgi:ABC-2 type transport system permease protein
MNGGKVMWFIDPIDVNRDSLAFTGETMGLSRNLNIEKDLIYKYGARINNDIIYDNQCANELVPPNNSKSPGLPWGFYPLLELQEHPITVNLDPIKAEYVSSVTPVNLTDKAVTKTVLLQSSIESKALMAPVRFNYGFAFEQYKPDVSNPQFASNPVAVLLEGEFSSPFENRISDAFIEGSEFITKFKSVPNKMLVVSDGDMINSSFTHFSNGQKKISPIPLSVDRFNVVTPNGAPKFNYGNREFFLNAVDYLLGDNSLIGIRSKTITLRMLDSEKISKERSFWKFVNITFPLLFIVIFAVIQMLIRKRKYSN